MASVFREHTSVPAQKSISEIIAMLAQAGARGVSQDFEGGECVKLTFSLSTTGGLLTFQLPARIEPLFNKLVEAQGPRSKQTAEDIRASAYRIAWRQLYCWAQAQLALIETEMVQAAEVFMPYMLDAGGQRTMWESLSAGKLLGPGKKGDK